jgi:hypothetical protein
MINNIFQLLQTNQAKTLFGDDESHCRKEQNPDPR